MIQFGAIAAGIAAVLQLLLGMVSGYGLHKGFALALASAIATVLAVRRDRGLRTRPRRSRASSIGLIRGPRGHALGVPGDGMADTPLPTVGESPPRTPLRLLCAGPRPVLGSAH